MSIACMRACGRSIIGLFAILWPLRCGMWIVVGETKQICAKQVDTKKPQCRERKVYNKNDEAKYQKKEAS